MVLTCCCETCTVVRDVTSWGSNSTTIGQGSTEQNGNWEILSSKLRVATADAIITWDAGINDWQIEFATSMTWDITGAVATDFAKEIRFIFNYVDNSNYDYVSIRRQTTGFSLASFCERSGGVDTTLHPTGGILSNNGLSGQFRMTYADSYVFTYKDEILSFIQTQGEDCTGGNLDSYCSGRSWYRARVNNIVGIGTGPSWTGNADFGLLQIRTPGTSNCVSTTADCWGVTKPACGCDTMIVPKTVTVTIGGTPYTCYNQERLSDHYDLDRDYEWMGIGGPPYGPYLAIVGSTGGGTGGVTGDIYCEYNGNTWLLDNSGSARTDCDAWTSLSLTPVAPNVTACDITGNY